MIYFLGKLLLEFPPEVALPSALGFPQRNYRLCPELVMDVLMIRFAIIGTVGDDCAELQVFDQRQEILVVVDRGVVDAKAEYLLVGPTA